MTIPVRNPRTGEVDYAIEAVPAEEIAAIARRLRAAQSDWLAMGAEARAAILVRWAEAIEARSADLVTKLSVDTGRVAIANVEVFSVAGTLRRWAATGPAMIAAMDLKDVPSATPGVTISTRHVPYQLLGVIAPWNFPLLLALIDAIPALLAGCAALIKPSEITPRFIPVLRETVAAVPELAQVLAIVEGDADTGRAIVGNVDYVCFTGSVATGRKVAEAAAAAFIPANLELGGKDPMIVLPSADPAKAASIALRSSVAANGQACQSIERLYVHRSLADAFLASLVEQAKGVEFNYPDIGKGHIGPFIFPPQADKVQAQIDAAVAQGAKVLHGGKVETLGGGKYLRPTVLTDVTPDMAIIAEETFGPVIPVTVYDDVEEAIRLANDTIYGLSAAVIGDPAEAEKVGERLEAGAISINDGSLTAGVWDAENCSFKQSGMGPSRMGDAGLYRYFRVKAIMRQNGEAAPIAAYAEQPPLG
ncbi:aldehyde dehydrogenase family protein [Novosphingobium sp.]|jgi:acyl-CoA reductase-like NAD-dependent aldehyde dehydrogenase|uniref:aldehyde dehydrogenase family protein n=1 Tax=Novosphingobium sp. TaxID=1874826 RepID=UPI0022CB3C86|nr:aldehyde dehydrogenase family protein [Novosphingobium sp.]MCZ8019486.1 aldehyde dehydrogenase family protein [Novosphingobium sp.]MCZ8035301.1 aldehyde dehydrogenase family protein [Novosphingobium sp.]MCZ8050615.1 aldehyde dehydrogenase family protein [Novosphingobium sp.]MCZ8058961.1 aldehyde dehydrogenase family protein [Novosphingobium sp.]MCZ8232406.1 aldehyde dehydrogenase family protein [Novosphingobium sp.]